jgi:hypothetical protein
MWTRQTSCEIPSSTVLFLKHGIKNGINYHQPSKGPEYSVEL